MSVSGSGPSAQTMDRSEGTFARTARACSSRLVQVNIAEISACPRIAIISGVERRVFAGTITAPALCTAAYATIHRRQYSFGSAIATRSPLRMPLSTSQRAAWFDCSSHSLKVSVVCASRST